MRIDIKNLIREVRKRTVIYDSNSPAYHDRKKKKLLWEEICCKLNSEWLTYNKTNKLVYSKEVLKKWNSLRDCFRRDLHLQRNAPTGSDVKIKSKYKYFDLLLFLEPYTQVKNQGVDNSSYCNSNDTESDDGNGHEIVPEINDANYNSVDDDNEDDRLFLLSLLPSFKNTTMDEKYLLRIEIMKTIMKFKHMRRELGCTAISVETENPLSLAQHPIIKIENNVDFL